MARPQTYTDSKIVRAIQALIAEGGTVNPMRVKRRLGGGNVSRIKVLLAKMLRSKTKKNAELPPDLMLALEGLVRETALQAGTLAEDYWRTGSTARGKKPVSERATLKRRIADLGSDLASARQHIAQLEMQHAQDHQKIAIQAKEQTTTAEATSRLHTALRNAESDLRAAQRIIDTFERNQRQDREDIRRLQTHNEILVAELATLRAGKEATGKKSSEEAARG